MILVAGEIWSVLRLLLKKIRQLQTVKYYSENYLCNVYCMSGTMLSPLHASHFILTTILCIGSCFHAHLTDEAEAQRAELPKDTGLESDSGQEHT